MSAAEALHLQLETLQTELCATKAENRRDANPQQAELLETESELAHTREENVRLVQEVNRLSEVTEGEARTPDEESVEISGLREAITTREREAATTRQSLEKVTEQLREKEEECRGIEKRAERAMGQVQELMAELEQRQRDAELERWRAVAVETRRKWEEREARLVQHLEDLKQRQSESIMDGGEQWKPAILWYVCII